MELLIRPEWFEARPQWLLLMVAAIATYLVIKGADWMVEGASGIALRLGVSKMIIGATIVSLGTTAPECAVSVFAAWTGRPGLALGNAVGSVIADTGLIFGVGCLLMALPADRFILNRQGWVQFGSALFLAMLCYGSWVTASETAALGRPVGLLLLALLGWYLWISIRWGRAHRQSVAHVGIAKDEPDDVPAAGSLAWLAGMFVAGLVLVIFFAQVLIASVEEIARQWGVPQVVIAATIVALGTSLPELLIGVTAVRRGHPELLIGNVIGADILNVLFVIGASAFAARLPLLDADAPVPGIFLVLHIPTMLVILGLFRIYIFSAMRFGMFRRWFGVPMVAIYVAYVSLNYMLLR